MERIATQQLAEAGIDLKEDKPVAYFKLDKSRWNDPEFNYWAWTQEMLDKFGHMAQVYRREMDNLVSTSDYVARTVHVNETEKVIFDDGYAILIYKSTAREGTLKIFETAERKASGEDHLSRYEEVQSIYTRKELV